MALVALSGIGDIFSDVNSISQQAGTLTNPLSAGLKAIETLSALFANKPSPNDWVGWDEQDRNLGQWEGSSVRGYVLNDGDSVQNEALNIVSYIKSKGIEKLVNSGHPVTIQGQGWRDVTIDEIIDKLSRGGYGSEASEIKNAYLAYKSAYSSPSNLLTAGSAASKTAGMNIFVTLAIAGAAIYAISKYKK